MNKLKRGLSLLLTLVMVLSMIPVSHAHGAATHSCTIGGQNVTWKEWTSANSLPTTAGNYYLTKDVTLTSRADLIDGLVLCLNGKTLTAPEIMVGYGKTVTITDCVGTGKLTTSASTNVLSVNGTCNFYGGTITGANRSGNAGGVYVNNVFNMYGGEISGNKASRGAGVYISTSDFWGTTGVFNMYGGTITGNTAAGSGGGVYVNRNTTFNMYGGTLNSNVGSGSGAYVEGTFNLFGGSIGSSSVLKSGGLYNKSYYQVVFQMNGYGTQVEKKSVLENHLATAPTAPTDENATFVGWYKDEALTTPWDFAADKVTDDTTLYAKWEAHVHNFESGICTGCGVLGGYCGDPDVNDGKDVTWTLADGVLTISGTGRTREYGSVAEMYGVPISCSKLSTPWNENEVTSLVVEEGVTHILGLMCWGVYGLTEVSLPDSLKVIGNCSFEDCDNLTSITIPKNVTSIWNHAFFACDNLTSITFTGDAPNIEDHAFSNVVTATCYYPAVPSWTAEKRQSYGGNLTWVPYGVCTEGHTWVDATCAAPKTCSVCGETEGEPAADRHNFVSETCTICGLLGGSCGSNLIWTLDTEGNLVITGTGDMRDYDFGTSPFYKHADKITSVSLPDGLTSIGERAFDATFPNLDHIEIPTSVTHIQECAFGAYYDRVKLKYPGTMAQWENLYIAAIASYGIQYGAECSDGTIIYMGPCSGSNGLYDDVQYMLLGDGTLKITGTGAMKFYRYLNYESCFSGDDKITKVVIDEGVTSIAGYAFKNCENLTEVYIPASVTSISYNVFQGCTALTDVYYGSNEKNWNKMSISSDSNEPLAAATIHYTDLCAGGHSWVDATCVAPKTCSVCDATEGEPQHTWVAATCSAPKTCSSCGATEGEANPDAHNYENYVCTGCGAIGGQCGENVWWQFREADGTLTIFGSGDMADYAEYGNNAPWRSQYTSKIQKVVIEEGVTGIGSFSFWQCDNLEEITIAQSVQRMGDGVFYGCDNLAAVTIPNGVPTIGQNAFYGCVSLYSLHIPESVTTIGVSAFVCSGLRYVVLPKSVTKIDGNAFGGCDKLWHVLYTGTESQRNSIEVVSDSRLYRTTWHYQAKGDEIVAATGSNCVENHLFKCEICQGECIETIYNGQHTWQDATCITPKTCSSCGATQGEANPDAHTYENSVCTGCGAIGGQCGPEVYWVLKDKEIVIYGTGKMWDFDDGSAPFYPADAVIEGVNIRPGVTTVGANAFDECDTLLYLTLPETLTSIGYKAFYNCDLLVSVPLPESLTSIGREAFRNCAKITAITIPGRVETIDRQAFGGCTGLTEIYIPDSVTHLGELAFMDCSGLREATIGNGVKSIGQYTFAQCTSLVAVKLGKRVETIGMMAFYECDQLWHVFFGGSASQWTNMSIEEHNDCLADAICHYNQSNTPGAYISYDDTVTCTRSGRYTCILCGTSKEILIPGGEHTWVDGSCTSTPHCEKCGEDGPLADGHDPEFISGQKATCEYAGWYDYYRCQDCGEFFEDEACRHFIYDLTEWRTIGFGKENKLPHSEVCGVCANCGIGLNLGDYVYTLDEAAMTVTLTDYIGSGTDVHVAASYLLDGKEYRTLLEATSVFRGNTAITSVIIDDGVTTASNSMAEMFYGCAALKTADLRGLDTTGVTSLRRLFSECKKLVSVDVTGWDTSAVADMSYLFDYCNALTTITGYENWNTGSVWNINKAFNRTSTIAVVDLSKWDLSKVTNSGWCFQMCYAEEILLPDNLAVMSAGFLNHPTKYAGTTFTVPGGVKKIGYAHTIYDFGTDAFTAFEVPAQNGYYEAVDGILYSEDGTELIAVPRGKTFENGVFEVPNTVTFMGELSFSRNYNIQTLVLPDNYIIEYVPLYDSRYILTDGHGGNDTGNLNSGTNLSIAIYCYTGITAYDVRDTNTRYEAVDGVIYTEDMTALVAVPARYAQKLNIPEGVTTWQKEAMWADHAGNSNLLSLLENCTGVSIPATLSQIDAEQLSMINRLADRTSSAFTITVAEGNRTFHVNPTTGHLEAHTYSAVVTEPGCENAGYTTHTCSICEDSYKTDPVPAKEHDWADADCITPKTCKVCGETEGAPLDHNWADADCDTPKTCKVCGATEGTAAGHAWIDATCYSLKTCNNCGITVGEMLKHDWVDADCQQPKHCKNCTATEGSAPGHDWADADCENPKTCKRCGETEGTYIGHRWIEASCYNPRTCSVCGKIDSVSWGHDWQAVVDGTGEICNKCGATRGDVHSHTWLPATCSAPETCTSCGVTRGQKLPHTPVVDPAVEASCTTEGKSEGSHCAVCLQPLVVQLVIPLKAHTEETDPAVAATCTTTGLTEGKHCSACGKVIVAQQTVPTKAHTPVTDPAVDATCTTTGLTEGKHCSACGKVIVAQQVVPTKAHVEVPVNAVAATCTTTGLTEGSHCSVCGKVIKEQDKIPAMGHTPVADAAVEATCTATGLTAGAHCVVCDQVIKAQQTVAKKDHTWKAATCSEPKTCTACGTTSGYALGHDWAAGNCTTPKTCKVCGAKDGGVVHTYEHQYDYKCDLCGTERIVDMTRPMVDMFRMYNPNTGEHFYTGSTVERDNLISVGWQYEGVGFTFPLTTGKPVHRLFQPSTGEHLYTMDEAEKAKLMAEGWNYEGIAFNSGFENEVPQYRLHNPNATVGAYHFTASLVERDTLISLGWEYQGIGWYSLGA